MQSLFPIFQGNAPIGHPYPQAFRGNVVIGVAVPAPEVPKEAQIQSIAQDDSKLISNNSMQHSLKQIIGVTRTQGVPHSASTLMFLCSSQTNVRLQLPDQNINTKNMAMISYDQAKKNIPELLCDYLSARIFEAKK